MPVYKHDIPSLKARLSQPNLVDLFPNLDLNSTINSGDDMNVDVLKKAKDAAKTIRQTRSMLKSLIRA